MKLLLIYFLIIFNLYADITSQFKQEIVNTSVQTNLSDKEIQNLIINKIIPMLDKPILESKKDKNLTKVLLTRDDYKLLFNYLKDLQLQNKTKEAINIYIKIIKGINKIDNTKSINLIYRIIMGNITLKSLEFDIKNYFSQEEKLFLKKSLPNLLILKESDLNETSEIKLDLLKVIKLNKDVIKLLENRGNK